MFTTMKKKFEYRQLRPGDPNFRFSPDGIMTVPRAGFEISQRCPENYRDLIQECIQHGWLKPVAYIKDHELTFDILTEGN